MKAGQVEEKVRRVATPFLEDLGMELVQVVYGVEHGRKILRVLVDKAGGITLDDLARLSGELGALLDVEDVVPERYNLEVSSPGLDRPLLKEKDYVRFAGKKASIRTKGPVEGRKNFKAVILGVEAGRVLIEDADRKRFSLALSEIDRARLVVEL